MVKKQLLHLFISFIIVVASLYYVFKSVSLSELTNAFRSLRYIYLLPAIFLVALSYLVRAIRWRYLITSVKKVKTVNLFSPLMIGFMGNMLPARAGEVIRAYLLSKKEDLSFSASFATIFIERLFDMSLVLLLLFWVLIFESKTFVVGDSGETHQLMGYMVKFGWISFAGCLFIFLFSALLQYKNNYAMNVVGVITKPLPNRWVEKLVRLVNSFTQGLNVIKDKKGLFATVFLSFLLWGTFVFMYYPLYFAFEIENQLPVIPSLVILCVTIAIFIALFPTPGFLGSFQAACVVALHEIFKIPKAIAASYGIIAWLVIMGFVVVIGLIFIIKENISFAEFQRVDSR
jgi:hypothetical protein